MAKKNWIAGAIKHPGALHKQMGVPEGQNIPEGRLAKAAQSGGKLGQRARLAETLKGFSHLPKGVSQTPEGDIGAHRAAEASELGTFRNAQAMTEQKAGWKGMTQDKMIDSFPALKTNRDGTSAHGDTTYTKAGDADFPDHKKGTPFTGYAPNTPPPLGRALPVRGEHED